MPDYKGMYLYLSQQTEKALRILMKAQQVCEEMLVKDAGPEPPALDDLPNGEERPGAAGEADA